MHKPLANLQVTDWGLLDYGEAFRRQKKLVADRIADKISDQLVMVEHPPAVTIGRSGSRQDLYVTPEDLRIKRVNFHRIDRGGKATFHGPGQVVAYPILKLEDKDLHAFLKRLLNTLADVLQSYGLVPVLRDSLPGVWVGNAKIASVGLAAKKWVTYHGAALNVSVDPGWYDLIIPCGRPNEKVTSIENETGDRIALSDVKKKIISSFCRIFGYKAPSEITRRHPEWLIRPAPDKSAVDRIETFLGNLNLETVCQSALCPNLGECFGRGTATFMILGTHCTRKCRFCAVEKGSPGPVDEDEPVRVAQAVRMLGLNHAVVTSVTRDDLTDGGSEQFVRTIQQIRKTSKNTSVEVLIPDFNGSIRALQSVCAIRPDILNHNVETVPRLYGSVRPKASYRRSLSILSYASSHGLIVKSGLMLGLGETEIEINNTLRDLRRVGCVVLTLGQYLAPSADHLPVSRFVSPEEFQTWAETARAIGFKSVVSGPLVRSSYRAESVRESKENRIEKNVRESTQWEPNDLSSRLAAEPTCMVKTPPRPHAGL